jgi:hypothetical protein
MSARILSIHWNELSFADGITPEELQSLACRDNALSSANALREIIKDRPHCRISFSRGLFSFNLGGKPFQTWLEYWLGKDLYRRLRAAAIQPCIENLPEIHDLDCELYCNGRAGDGITRAYISETWTWSIGIEGKASMQLIDAIKSSPDGPDADVSVQNIANINHARAWHDQIALWGHTASQNHQICVYRGYQIIMYPLDHGYPHIHIKRDDMPELNAKYRVDAIEELTVNDSSLNSVILPWVANNQAALLESWRRCQSGKYPLKIA